MDGWVGVNEWVDGWVGVSGWMGGWVGLSYGWVGGSE